MYKISEFITFILDPMLVCVPYLPLWDIGMLHTPTAQYRWAAHAQGGGSPCLADVTLSLGM